MNLVQKDGRKGRICDNMHIDDCVKEVEQKVFPQVRRKHCM
jgi:hypothetical protein